MLSRFITVFLSTAFFMTSPFSALSEVSSAGQDNAEQKRNEKERVDSINRIESADGPAITRSSPSSELTGVMVDRTITMAGKTFYRAFSNFAMGSPLIGNATITFRERPDARWGSQLWIMEGSRIYFRTQLSPRINEADNAAKEAVQIVEKALLRRRLEVAITSEKDLGSEELF
ncbi:CsgE family curli-type amyloid fiber assembly protein [Oceanimonas smirnovii]|uniref:Curli production assembly/transport component CsgE n=1 Tax=Oceanimonas smirnovii TaxID=264574 RepID=A0ABW7P091_9GAMM